LVLEEPQAHLVEIMLVLTDQILGLLLLYQQAGEVVAQELLPLLEKMEVLGEGMEIINQALLD
jgi:hypothetical protein